MKPLEALYLVVGVGIIVRGTIDHGLTPTELGAGMFFVGLVPVSRADKRASGKRAGIRQAIVKWLQADKSEGNGAT